MNTNKEIFFELVEREPSLSIKKIKMNQCPIVSDCLHRQTKCGKCVNQDQYDWDYTQMI